MAIIQSISPSGDFINETNTRQAISPSGAFVNETTVIEIDISVSMALGVSEASSQPNLSTLNFPSTHALGISEAAPSIDKGTLNITSTHGIGISEAASITPETDITASAALGISEAATVYTEEDEPSTTMALGVAQTVVLSVRSFGQPILILTL